MPLFAEVRTYLEEAGLQVFEFSVPTPTVETAAAAVGCSPAEIAKSVLLVVGGKPVLVVTCGDTRVNSSLLKKASGLTGKVRFPEAGEVEAVAGYRPGGVSPFLLPDGLKVLLDESLKRFSLIYPAAGNDRSAVALAPDQLQEHVDAEFVKVALPLAVDG